MLLKRYVRDVAVAMVIEMLYHPTQHINSVHHNIRASCLTLIGQVIPASSDQPLLVAMVSRCLTDGDYRVRRAALEAMVTHVM